LKLKDQEVHENPDSKSVLNLQTAY